MSNVRSHVSHRQRRLVREWLVGGGLLLAFVVFDEFAEGNAWWLRFVVMTLAMIALAGRSRLELADAGRSNLADLADNAPWLKVWVGICGVAIAIAAIYITKRSIDLSSFGFFGVILIPLAIMFGPFVVLNERRKFIELGEIDGAT